VSRTGASAVTEPSPVTAERAAAGLAGYASSPPLLQAGGCQLPSGFALVIRGGCAPVIARLPRAWHNPAYKRARRRGLATAILATAFAAADQAAPGSAVRDEELPPDPFPPGTSFPWS
jgi:hypothetical protein